MCGLLLEAQYIDVEATSTCDEDPPASFCQTAYVNDSYSQWIYTNVTKVECPLETKAGRLSQSTAELGCKAAHLTLAPHHDDVTDQPSVPQQRTDQPSVPQQRTDQPSVATNQPKAVSLSSAPVTSDGAPIPVRNSALAAAAAAAVVMAVCVV